MSKKDLPAIPPIVPSVPGLDDPRMQAFLHGAQVQTPQPSPPPANPSSAAAPQQSAQRAVKDGFSMPQADYDLIAQSADRALDRRIVLTKSGVLRAAVRVLAELSDEDFFAAIAGLEEVKPGRKRKVT